MMQLPLRKVNEEVFLATDPIIRFDRQAIEWLKVQALNNRRGRARICAHPSNDDPLHEMLIAIRSDSYVRPHRHLNKSESFHLIEGSADIVILDDQGEVIDVIALDRSKNFYYRLNTPHYHTLLLNSPILVIHEITNGPFLPSGSEFASFSPTEGEEGVATYITSLRQRTSVRR